MSTASGGGVTGRSRLGFGSGGLVFGSSCVGGLGFGSACFETAVLVTAFSAFVVRLSGVVTAISSTRVTVGMLPAVPWLAMALTLSTAVGAVTELWLSLLPRLRDGPPPAPGMPGLLAAAPWC